MDPGTLLWGVGRLHGRSRQRTSGRILGYIWEKMSGTNFPTHSRALAEERKLEDSPNDRPGTNCTFTENTEHIAETYVSANCQRTRAICGLIREQRCKWNKLAVILLSSCVGYCIEASFIFREQHGFSRANVLQQAVFYELAIRELS